MSMYFPNGTTDKFWLPAAAGPFGTAPVSAILEPLAPSNKYMTVLAGPPTSGAGGMGSGGISNYSAYGSVHAEPSHGTNCAGAWHCHDPRGRVFADSALKTPLPASGISVDQVIAAQIGSLTALPSLQIGLSTLDSYCDGVPCGHSRSLSWDATGMPLYKIVNPQAVFDRLVMAGAPMAGQSVSPTPTTMATPDPALAQTRALKKSVLDSVLASATTLRTKVSTSDQARIDQYLTSVRDLEKLVTAPAMQVGLTGGGVTTSCTGIMRPPEPYADMNTPPDYSRETHANLMIQLATLAFACDITRTISFMLDDARSDYVYSHVPMRLFNMPAGGALSSAGNGTAAGYHGLQHAGNTNDGFATITHWMAIKVNMMVQALAAIAEGGATVMDTTVIHFGSGMHGGNHDGLNIPTVLLGSGGGVLKMGQYIVLPGSGPAPGGGQRMADLHLTLIQKVFGSPATSFGNPPGYMAGTGAVPGASSGVIPDILV
jgi:hypothetical protein